MPVVKGVRAVQAPDGRHEHIAGLCTAEGVFYSRDDVANAILAGEDWWLGNGDQHVPLRLVPRCGAPGCPTAPYLVTGSGEPALLDALPRC